MKKGDLVKIVDILDVFYGKNVFVHNVILPEKLLILHIEPMFPVYRLDQLVLCGPDEKVTRW